MGTDPRVLITGGSGQVGSELMRILQNASAPGRARLDVADPASVSGAVAGMDVVVHLAAYTDVDGCEVDAEHALAVNDRGTSNVASACSETGSFLIYLSTDYVFDGTKDDEYREVDDPHPINVYGVTKLAGEAHVLDNQGALVVRTSTVYGKGPNFVRSIFGAAASGHDRLEVVADQISRPTAAADLAAALAWAINERPAGILHIAGTGITGSRAELAEAIVEAGGFGTKVVPVSSEAYNARSPGTTAPRPRNSVLSLAEAERCGAPLFDQRASLEAYVEGLL